MRLVWLALAWIAGIVAAAAMPGGWLVPWLLIGAFGLALRLPSLRRHAGASGVLLVALALGGARMALNPDTGDLRDWHGLGGMTLHGVVAGSPTPRDTSVGIVVEVEQVERAGSLQAARGRALVEAPPGTQAGPGDRIAATGLLARPPDGDRFSYADYLARRGIGSVLTQAYVTVTPSTSGFAPGRWLADARNAAQGQIARALPEPYAALLSGIVLGDDSRISPDIETAFAVTGTAHILAISGYNMAIVALVVSMALRRAGLGPWKTALLSIAFILLYAAFVGGSAAILRAALMSSLLVFASALKRRAFVPASVALAVGVLSLFDPFVLWDLGLQFSVAATLGLATFAEPLTRAVERWLSRFLHGRALTAASVAVGTPLAATLAAQITTTPLSVLNFGALSLASLPVNLLVLPVQPAVLLIGGLAVVVSPLLAPLGQALFWAALLPLAWTTSVIRAFAALPFAQVDASLSPALAVASLLAMSAITVLQATEPGWHERAGASLRQRGVIIAGSVASLTVLVLALAMFAGRPDGQLHVHFLDVGHSNAVLIQSPGGAQVLVDGGRLPSRLLTALGDRMPVSDQTLEAVVVTQPDANEYAALADVADRYGVALLVTNGQPHLDPAWTALLDRMGGATQHALRAGESIELSDGLVIEAHHPANTPASADRLDDHALLLRLRYGDITILLTGDLSREAQTRLVEAGDVPPAHILQLPQHATARSLDASFFAAVAPQAIIVQSAADNRRGDPNADTLALLGRLPLYRTDEAGALHLWTDGDSVWIQGERRGGL